MSLGTTRWRQWALQHGVLYAVLIASLLAAVGLLDYVFGGDVNWILLVVFGAVGVVVFWTGRRPRRR